MTSMSSGDLSRSDLTLSMQLRILVGVFARVPGQSWCQDGKSDFRVLEFKGITCCQDLTPQKLFLQSEPEGVFRICRYHLSRGTAQDSANYSYAFLAVGLWFDYV